MPQNLGETIRRKQQRILELRQEIADLQAELKEARSILTGKFAETRHSETEPRDTPRLIAHRARPQNRSAIRKRPIKEGSTVWWARRLLRVWKHDEHIDKLVAEIERAMAQPVSKPTVVSNLSRYVARNDTFTRPAENRYGLIDYEAPEEMPMAG